MTPLNSRVLSTRTHSILIASWLSSWRNRNKCTGRVISPRIGDKTGNALFYDRIIPMADDLYDEHRAEIESTARVVNAPATMRWNAHKGYLHGLAERGIPIVPTIFLSLGNHRDFEEIAAELRAREFVIKPAVSASAFRTTVIGKGYEPREAAAGILEMLVRDRDAMVQPFMREIFAFGERSLVFIAGTFSHAIRRTPIAHGEAGAETSNARIDIPAEQHDFAQRVLGTAARSSANSN
jgi:hypothetical protein